MTSYSISRCFILFCALQTLLRRIDSVEAFVTPLFGRPYALETFLLANPDETADTLPAEITTTALKQIYPKLMEHKEIYGNPNIPLGTPEGRKCYNIRRMQTQGKLTDLEVDHLAELGFIFHTLEDVYDYADFDDMEARLKAFKAENGHLDIKKKHALDPELGAWVTGVRRLGKERIAPEHVARLDSLGFLWESPRQCGSKFMIQYRDIYSRLENGEDSQMVFEDPDVVKFIRTNKESYRKNTISETRIEYLNRLLGEKWWEED